MVAIVAGLAVLYALAYVVISRLGYAKADQYQLDGFYYVFPENTDAWRATNRVCEILFYPANALDRWIGFGRYPASEPLYGPDSSPQID